jgi:hypothetical protein
MIKFFINLLFFMTYLAWFGYSESKLKEKKHAEICEKILIHNSEYADGNIMNVTVLSMKEEVILFVSVKNCLWYTKLQLKKDEDIYYKVIQQENNRYFFFTNCKNIAKLSKMRKFYQKEVEVSKIYDGIFYPNLRDDECASSSGFIDPITTEVLEYSFRNF